MNTASDQAPHVVQLQHAACRAYPKRIFFKTALMCHPWRGSKLLYASPRASLRSPWASMLLAPWAASTAHISRRPHRPPSPQRPQQP